MRSQSQPLCLFYTPPSEGISLGLRAIIIIHLISQNIYASSDIFVAVADLLEGVEKSRSKHEKHHILRTRQQVPNGCSCMDSSNLNIWWFYTSRGAPQFTIITPLQRFPCFWPPRDWFIRLIFVSTKWRERDVKKLKMCPSLWSDSHRRHKEFMINAGLYDYFWSKWSDILTIWQYLIIHFGHLSAVHCVGVPAQPELDG